MSIILHHYPLSPFSEKIRAMLGYCELDWMSCITSEAPPRGRLDFLTGGYGRIPVAQIGSDIFCDSNLIATEIAALSKQPSLSPLGLQEEEKERLRWMETKLFFACINRSVSLSLLRRIVKEKGIINLGIFLKDRIEMGAKASISLGSPRSAPRHIDQAKSDLDALLSNSEFWGGSKPNLLDFAMYHGFWFLKEVGAKNDIDDSQARLNWFKNLNDFSVAATQECQIEDALAEAKRTKPRKIETCDLQDYRIGSEITITPNDYRQIPVQGELVGVNDERWIVRLDSSLTDDIHLHFPRYAMDVNIKLGERYWNPKSD